MTTFVRAQSTQPKPALPALKPLRLLHRRYRIRRHLGSGGFGSVYLADDTLLGIPVAVKVVWPEDAVIFRLQKEARLLATLSHPSLTNYVDLFEERGQWYLVMEYVEGKHLQAWLKARGPMPFELLLQVAEMLFDVLDYLSHCVPAVIHCDIKPQNLLLTPKSALYLLDLGIACEPGSNEVIASSQGYSAPEQWENGPITPLIDVYAAGVLLRELLTGKPPVKQVHTVPVSPVRTAPDPSTYSLLSEQQQAFYHLLDQMTEPHPALRPNIQHAWAELERIEHLPASLSA